MDYTRSCIDLKVEVSLILGEGAGARQRTIRDPSDFIWGGKQTTNNASEILFPDLNIGVNDWNSNGMNE